MSFSENESVSIFTHVVERTQRGVPFCEEMEMKRPVLSLTEFWHHLKENFDFSEDVEMESYIILWKIMERNLKVSKNLMYKIKTVCLILAEKLLEDETHSLEMFSLVSGISMKDLQTLEIEVLKALDFDIKANDEELEKLHEWISL